jgi:hypothetical protein
MASLGSWRFRFPSRRLVGWRGFIVWGRLDATQGHVDDVSGEPVVEWRVAVEQPVVERAVEQVEGYLDVGVGGDFAAFGGAVEEGPGLVPAWLDYALAVLGGEGGVGVCLGEEGCDYAGVGSAAG